MAAAILASAALRRAHDERRHSANESEIEPPEPSAAQAGEHAEIDSWDSAGVATWLASRGLPQDVVRAARDADVDGATLMELTHGGWAELGLVSKVAQAKIRAAVRRVNHHHEVYLLGFGDGALDPRLLGVECRGAARPRFFSAPHSNIPQDAVD